MHSIDPDFRSTLIVPTEVCERIIDFVAEEYRLMSRARRWQISVLETLQACALTCRAWTPRSQLHLFRFVGISCSTGSANNVNNFTVLLAAHQALHTYIESLQISAEGNEVTTMHVLPFRAPELVARLGQLSLFHGVLWTPCGSVFCVAMQQFKSVTQLVLWEVEFQSVHDLRRTVNALRGLRHLNMTRVTWQLPCNPMLYVPYPRSKTRLARLWLKGEAEWLNDSRSIYFIEWLARSGVASFLQRADFYHAMAVSNKLMAAVESVIKTCKDTVEEIILSLCPDVDISRLSRTLSHCGKLRLLRLRCPYDSQMVSNLAAMLSAPIDITCPQLYLPFDEYSSCRKPTTHDWELLEGAFQREHCSSLKELFLVGRSRVVEDVQKFVLGNTYPEGSYNPSDAEKWCAELKTYLPLVMEQGKLWYGTDNLAKFARVK